jgi:polar amino acid transport system substrate-binding protein
MKKIIILCVLTLLASNLLASSINDIKFMSEDFPPFNYLENKKLKGKSADVVIQIFKKLNLKEKISEIKFYPWARSYKYIKERKNTALFAVTRTAEREHLFKWVGPISSSRNVLLAPKTSEFKKNNLESLKKLTITIGGVRADAALQLTKKLFNKETSKTVLFFGASRPLQLLKMSAKKRIDVIAYDENVFKWIAKKNNFPAGHFEVIYELSKSNHYIAFHKDTPDEVIELMQNALDQINQSN